MMEREENDSAEKIFKKTLQNKKLFESRLKIVNARIKNVSRLFNNSRNNMQKSSEKSINTSLKPYSKKILSTKKKEIPIKEDNLILITNTISNNISLRTTNTKINKIKNKKNLIPKKKPLVFRNKNTPFLNKIDLTINKKVNVTIGQEGSNQLKKMGAITLKLNKPNKNDYLSESNSALQIKQNVNKTNEMNGINKNLMRNKLFKLLKQKTNGEKDNESKNYWNSNSLSFDKQKKINKSIVGNNIYIKKFSKNYNTNYGNNKFESSLSGLLKEEELKYQYNSTNKKILEYTSKGKNNYCIKSLVFDNINKVKNKNKNFNRNSKLVLKNIKIVNNINNITNITNINNINRNNNKIIVSTKGDISDIKIPNNFSNKEKLLTLFFGEKTNPNTSRNGNITFQIENKESKTSNNPSDFINKGKNYLNQSQTKTNLSNDFSTYTKKNESKDLSSSDCGILSLDEVEDIIYYNNMRNIKYSDDFLFYNDDYNNFIKNKMLSIKNTFFPYVRKNIKVHKKLYKKSDICKK